MRRSSDKNRGRGYKEGRRSGRGGEDEAKFVGGFELPLSLCLHRLHFLYLLSSSDSVRSAIDGQGLTVGLLC